MLYLTLPLIISLAALVAVAVIVWRKMPFLRKLSPEAHEVGQTWLHDMAPEAIDWFNSIPWHQYLQNTLLEFEKFFRRLRLLFSAIDRASEQLVRKIRSAHQKTARQAAQHEEVQAAKKEEAERDPDEIDMTDPEQLRQEEQRLIVTIAQHSKDPVLYSDLARVCMRMRNFTDAVEALAMAVKLDPANESYAKRLESARQRLAQTTS